MNRAGMARFEAVPDHAFRAGLILLPERGMAAVSSVANRVLRSAAAFLFA
jgi:hypothetical protein